MKKLFVALSLVGYCTLLAAPTMSVAKGGDDKDKKTKKSCCSHKTAKSCTPAEKKACGDKETKSEKTI